MKMSRWYNPILGIVDIVPQSRESEFEATHIRYSGYLDMEFPPLSAAAAFIELNRLERIAGGAEARNLRQRKSIADERERLAKIAEGKGK